jgi:hypothetical protein
MPGAQTGETPYIQHHHFGAVIALRWPGGLGESPTSRPCGASRPALVRSLLKIVVVMQAWTVHYGRDVLEHRKSNRAVIRSTAAWGRQLGYPCRISDSDKDIADTCMWRVVWRQPLPADPQGAFGISLEINCATACPSSSGMTGLTRYVCALAAGGCQPA